MLLFLCGWELNFKNKTKEILHFWNLAIQKPYLSGTLPQTKQETNKAYLAT